MILLDKPPVEFLRATGSPACERVDALLDSQIATCDPVRMELLAGARDEPHLNVLRRLLARASIVPTGPGDYENAAVLYRTCRQSGETVRKLIDCFIAAVAIRANVPILHLDSDFDTLARYTRVRVEPL